MSDQGIIKGQAEIYQRLRAMTEVLPGWNFGKYVVSRDGRRARYFGPMTGPDSDSLRGAIDEALR